MARDNGEIITITAPDVEISGFEIRNSGVSSLEDLAGIKVSETGNATVSNNRLRDCNFGIYMSKANDCRVIDNEVRGKPGGEQESGNGIHLWSCENITVTGNTGPRPPRWHLSRIRQQVGHRTQHGARTTCATGCTTCFPTTAPIATTASSATARAWP